MLNIFYLGETVTDRRDAQGTQQVKAGEAVWVLIPAVFSSNAEAPDHYVWQMHLNLPISFSLM